VRFDGSILWIESSIDTLAIGVGTVFGAIILNDGVFDVVAFGVVKKPTLISDVADAVDVAALVERSSSQRIDGARVGFGGAKFLHHEFPVVVATESIAIVFNDIAGRHEIGLVLAGQIRSSTVPRDGIEGIETLIVDTDGAFGDVWRNADASLWTQIAATRFQTALPIFDLFGFIAFFLRGGENVARAASASLIG
jgi:hypothetical protein